MKLSGYILALLMLTACSTTVTGPITKNKYNLDVGCTDDMRDYKRVRSELVDEVDSKAKVKKIDLDCPVIE